jgi:hypothetical protein
MATETSNIDDLLMGGNVSSMQPETPEHQYSEQNTEEEYQEEKQPDIMEDNYAQDEQQEESEDIKKSEKPDLDDYGNEKPKPRTYTEDEVNERINKAVRERLARGNNQEQQLSQHQVQQQVKNNFEYDENSNIPWDKQLKNFIKDTLVEVNQEHHQEQEQQIKMQAQQEFRDKFSRGMDRFNDFVDVVSSQPVTPAMTAAMRGIDDPTAFIYAASKRHPQELQRISNLRDPYAQMVEMVKLEERMRTKPQGTNAPRPVSRTKEDGQFKEQAKKQDSDSIESLIVQSEARKIAKLKARRGN